jgi:UDP-N-acetylmuramate dehydrogenase
MEMLENISLKPYNTFGVEANTAHFCVLSNSSDLPDLLSWKTHDKPMLILGEGSNILFVEDFDGLIVHNALKGISIVEETNEHCILKVSAGENWSGFVDYTVSKGWGGIENLSLIPGTVGAAPIQNIGAYGVELKDVLVALEAVDLGSGEIFHFAHADCEFGYRSSVFKTSLKGRFFITNVLLKLTKTPLLKLDYAPLRKWYGDRPVESISVQEVSEAVKAIRRSKLPDPEEIGNAGSFFKNPVVPVDVAMDLEKRYPEIPLYPVDNTSSKLAAGWLIEKCGWKGRRMGDTGVHEKQALVLVNYGKASGAEVLDLSESVQRDVFDKFGVRLEREVTVV